MSPVAGKIKSLRDGWLLNPSPQGPAAAPAWARGGGFNRRHGPLFSEAPSSLPAFLTALPVLWVSPAYPVDVPGAASGQAGSERQSSHRYMKGRTGTLIQGLFQLAPATFVNRASPPPHRLRGHALSLAEVSRDLLLTPRSQATASLL